MAYDTREAEHILSLASARVVAGHATRKKAAARLFQEFIDSLGSGQVAGVSAERDSETDAKIYVTIGKNVHVDLLFHHGVFRAYLVDQGKSSKEVEVALAYNVTSGEYESTKEDSFSAPLPGESRRRRSALAELAQVIDSLVRPYTYVGD